MQWCDEMIDRVNAAGSGGEWATTSQIAASSAVDKLELPAIPDDALVDLVGCLIDEVKRLRADARRWDYVRGNLAQILSPKMDGQHSYRFRMLRATGCSVDEAVDKEIAMCRGTK